MEILMEWAKINVFVKPKEQSQTRLNSVMARKRKHEMNE